MPRTTTLECPGCPSLRALTFDALGLIKVIEAKVSQGGAPRVVERWGELDSSKCVLAASINDRKDDPLLAVARKTGMIEVLSAINGDIRFTVSNANEDGPRPEDDAVVGLHLFSGQKLELTSRTCTLLTCTTKGNTSMRSIEVTDSPAGSASIGSSNTWSVCGSGNILCSKVDGSEKYAIFGGKGVEMNMWDLDNCTKIWAAKSPPKNSLDIFTPTWFTSSTFLSSPYDISLNETYAYQIIYVGNGSGDLLLLTWQGFPEAAPYKCFFDSNFADEEVKPSVAADLP
ncbi:hypothetical protein CFP56_014303 [Quercus suber]|uniref:Uncharacterized protein n=1 Tax=Quercus suber TaxID=58331 RepID=A0AAW0KRU2_QUESU